MKEMEGEIFFRKNEGGIDGRQKKWGEKTNDRQNGRGQMRFWHFPKLWQWATVECSANLR